MLGRLASDRYNEAWVPYKIESFMSSSATDVAYMVGRAYDRARAGDLQGAAGVCAEVLQVDSSQPQAWLLR